MRIGIIGAGYVGLVTGAGLAECGNEVILVDIDSQKVNLINQAMAPFYEEGLEPLLKKSVGKNLRATLNTKEAVNNAEVVFFSVPTANGEDGSINLSNVQDAARQVGNNLREKDSYTSVVVKSTVIPGTTENVVLPILEKHSGKKAGRDFGVAANPEFLKEGTALADFHNPDRIVIGELDKKDGDILCELYRKLDAPILRVSPKTAEMIKYTSNTFLAAKISFINEIGNICKRMGIDVYRVAEGVGLDRRIGPHFLRAGIGFGGSCLPKDIRALTQAAKEIGYHPTLLEGIIRVNDEQPLRLLELAERKTGSLSDKKVAVLGLAFKSGTDDLRDAPSIKIIKALLNKGARVRVYDRLAQDGIRAIFGTDIKYADSARKAVADADITFVLNESDEFKDPELYRGHVFDGRRVIEPGTIKSADYDGICW
jgi:UDPglucose 6-dehydrogenase